MNGREQFEKWAVSKHYTIQKTGGRDQYASLATEFCWEAWQASRECIEVELPKGFHNYLGLRCYDRPEIIGALKAQGIKVK